MKGNERSGKGIAGGRRKGRLYAPWKEIVDLDLNEMEKTYGETREEEEIKHEEEEETVSHQKKQPIPHQMK